MLSPASYCRRPVTKSIGPCDPSPLVSAVTEPRSTRSSFCSVNMFMTVSLVFAAESRPSKHRTDGGRDEAEKVRISEEMPRSRLYARQESGENPCKTPNRGCLLRRLISLQEKLSFAVPNETRCACVLAYIAAPDRPVGFVCAKASKGCGPRVLAHGRAWRVSYPSGVSENHEILVLPQAMQARCPLWTHACADAMLGLPST